MAVPQALCVRHSTEQELLDEDKCAHIPLSTLT